MNAAKTILILVVWALIFMFGIGALVFESIALGITTLVLLVLIGYLIIKK